MRERPSRRGRQDWRHIGAGFVLVSVGLICLVFGSTLTNNKNDSHFTSNRGRIEQLEKELRAHDLPIPPPTTTTTSPPTVRRSRIREQRTSPGPTTTTTTTTPTTQPPPPSPPPTTCILILCTKGTP